MYNIISPTHFHIQTNTYSKIDLSTCSSDCMLDFDHQVQESLHGSDPSKLKLTETISHLNYPIRYKTEKADWTIFLYKTNLPLNHLAGNEANIDEQVQAMCSIIETAANESMTRNSSPMVDNRLSTG